MGIVDGYNYSLMFQLGKLVSDRDVVTQSHQSRDEVRPLHQLTHRATVLDHVWSSNNSAV